jgi:hypothetical protein
LGNSQDIAVSLANLGGIAMRKGDFTQARTLFTDSLTLFQRVGYMQGLAEMLEAFGSLEAAEGQAMRAAHCFGQAESMREAHGIPIPLPLRAERDRYADMARLALGEETFAAAWAEGRALAMEEVLTEISTACL